MIELFCRTFLIAFLFLYSALILVLVGWGVRKALQLLLKRARVFEATKRFRELALSPQTHRN
jgi:hypothetical protein